MPPRTLHPARELVRCPTHSHSWFPRAAGCSICRMARRAQQLADQPRTQPLVELVEEHTKLTTRAIEQAQNAIASIDRALSDDERARAKSHEAAALAEVRDAMAEALFAVMTAPPAARLRVVNSGFELEQARGES